MSSARICDAAGPSELLVSASVAHTLEGLDKAEIRDVGERLLKGIEAPTRLFAVRLMLPGPRSDEPGMSHLQPTRSDP